jgi:hypothetical protein
MGSEKGRYISRQDVKEPVGEYPEEKEALFNSLRSKESSELLHYLDAAYETMSPQQRRSTFGEILDQLRLVVFPGESLIAELEKFREDSINGKYYAPFEINSKNFMYKPPETEEWFDRIADFFRSATLLVEHGQYSTAVAVFELIYELIDILESGDEIVFADECGSWMIPIRENECVAAYLKAISCTENAVGFANEAVDLLKRDSRHSFTLKVYDSAMEVGTPEQKAAFAAKVEKLGLPIKGNW